MSNVIVKKLLSNCSFVDKLADKLLSNGVLDNVKQSVYEANAMHNKQTYATVTAMENRLGDLRTDNLAFADEVDDLEQYNWLLLHGMPESDEDSNEAVISVCNGKLELNISADDIDRSHRLVSSRHSNDDNNTRPRPIIVKFRSYETRRRVFSARRKLKGSKVVVTENLTKRRSELYKKVRALSNVQ